MSELLLARPPGSEPAATGLNVKQELTGKMESAKMARKKRKAAPDRTGSEWACVIADWLLSSVVLKRK